MPNEVEKKVEIQLYNTSQWLQRNGVSYKTYNQLILMQCTTNLKYSNSWPSQNLKYPYQRYLVLSIPPFFNLCTGLGAQILKSKKWDSNFIRFYIATDGHTFPADAEGAGSSSWAGFRISGTKEFLAVFWGR
jgi:hypothetical protein